MYAVFIRLMMCSYSLTVASNFNKNMGRITKIHYAISIISNITGHAFVQLNIIFIILQSLSVPHENCHSSLSQRQICVHSFSVLTVNCRGLSVHFICILHKFSNLLLYLLLRMGSHASGRSYTKLCDVLEYALLSIVFIDWNK